jgi:hypothetical protein
MNDLSATFDGDGERDKQIVDLVIGGKRVDDVAKMMACTVADVNLALDRAAQVYLTAQARVSSIFVDAARLERAQEACVPAANAGDDKAINCLAKLSERRSTLLGLNAPLRIDPIQLAQEAGPQLTSTQQLRQVFEAMRAQDKRALRNGGPGYGDWRDESDREEMARREREKADGLWERDGE